ncbi:hypothetical protein Tco_0248673, partial [Tanacetum coccineum]
MAEAVANKLVEEVAGSLLTKVKKEIGCMWSCKENVEKLRREAEKLKTMKERVEQKIKVALDKGDGVLAGKALKDEDNYKEWEKALYSIKKHETSDIAPSIRSEFAHLKLSYDNLESEEAKSIFLLCSMFPEDFHVPLEQLAYYGVGLQLFKDLNSLEDAR